MEEKANVEIDNRLCKNCHGLVLGRSDKQFCCDSCRIMYNNARYRNKYSTVNKIDRILRKNWSILDGLYSEGKVLVTHSDLHHLGFNFHYFTSCRSCSPDDPTGPVTLSCFDYDYSILEDGNVSLYKKATLL